MSPTPIFGDTATVPHDLDLYTQVEFQLRDQRARLSRLVALDPDRMTQALRCLIVIDPISFDLVLAASAPDPAEPAVTHLLQESRCLACQTPVARFTTYGGDWMHYTGDPLDSNIQPYEENHQPVIKPEATALA
jgi:hypothetical protein